MDCKAERVDRIRVKFNNLIVFGVPYKGNFYVMFKDGAWVPYREENLAHYTGWAGELYISRIGGNVLTEPSKAAKKRVAEICIMTASAWALRNGDALLQAEVEELRSMATTTDDKVQDMESDLQALKNKSSDQWEAVRAFKQLHGLT